MSDQATDLLLELYDIQQATAYSNLAVGIVFGAYVILYSTSLNILLRNDGLRLRATPRLFMLVVTTAMFALGFIALVLETSLAYQQFTLLLRPSRGSLWSTSKTNTVTAVGSTIACITYIIADVVFAWRAAVLWNYDRRIVATLALSVLGTVAAAGSALGINLRPLFSPPLQSPQYVSGTKLGGHRALIFVGPTLATNLLSTSLIGIQAWRKRQVLIGHLRGSSFPIKTEKVLAMLIESGFAYCCIWVLYLVSTFRVLPKPGFDVMDAVLLYFSGLYPTVIIICVVLRKSPTFAITTRSASTHHSDPPQLDAMEMGRPLSILYTQRKETHKDSDATMLPSPISHPEEKQWARSGPQC
ncbi:hypothetical protein F5148DRAFT_1247327 [Russula earlei]|uniref:Uncharacterized protein n=1 Tax=Russula earlei TaxID=71964 RepID=A0ACC0TUA7_9AGAM|nr:hypothetical protein F5148DRAFT_1247327 [Russula earlei]